MEYRLMLSNYRTGSDIASRRLIPTTKLKAPRCWRTRAIHAISEERGIFSITGKFCTIEIGQDFEGEVPYGAINIRVTNLSDGSQLLEYLGRIYVDKESCTTTLDVVHREHRAPDKVVDVYKLLIGKNSLVNRVGLDQKHLKLDSITRAA